MYRKTAEKIWIYGQNDLGYHKTSHYPCTGFNIKTTPHAFAIACVFLLQFDRPICENNSPKVYTPQSLLFIQTVESGMEPLLFLSLSVCMYFQFIANMNLPCHSIFSSLFHFILLFLYSVFLLLFNFVHIFPFIGFLC